MYLLSLFGVYQILETLALKEVGSSEIAVELLIPSVIQQSQ